MLTLRQRLFIFAGSLILTPVADAAASNGVFDYEAAQVNGWQVLDANQAHAAVRGLGAMPVSQDHNHSVRLSGFVYQTCKDHLKVETWTQGGKRAFILLAKKDFDACHAAEKAKETSGAKPEEVRLSEIQSLPVLDRLQSFSGKIELAWVKTDDDPAQMVYSELKHNGRALEITSVSAREDADDEDRKRKEAQRLARLDDETRTCSSKSKSQLEKTLEGIEDLLLHDKITEEEAERRRENVGEREYTLLVDQVESESGSDLEELDSEITGWESRWSRFKKANESAARLRLDLARKLSEDQDLSGTRGIEAGIEILENLSESSDTPRDLRSDAKTALTEMRSKLHQAKLSDEIQTRAARGESVASISRSINESRSFRDFQAQMDRETRAACGRTSAARSFGVCAQAQQARQTQQAQLNALLLEQLQAAERLQAALRMEQQQQQFGQFGQMGQLGQFGLPPGYGAFPGMQTPYRW
jgi:hypothetical protein